MTYSVKLQHMCFIVCLHAKYDATYEYVVTYSSVTNDCHNEWLV